MISWRVFVAGLATALVAACGGGGSDAGTPVVGPAPSPAVADLALVLSSATLQNSGTQTVTATVTAVDANRNAVPNVTVTLSVDANATIEVLDKKTGSDGKLTGTVGIGADRSLRKITVTASANGIVRTAEIQVNEAGSGGGTPKAADLTMSLSSATLPNSGTQTVTATVTAVDANRNTVAGIPVSFAVDQGGTVKVAANATDADGKVTAAVGIGDDRSNRVITVTAMSGTITKKLSVQVIGAQIRATLLPAVVNPGQAGKVQYRLTDVNGNAITGKPIVVTGPGGVQTTGTSDANGDYEYSYTAPTASGDLSIRASALGVEKLVTVTVLSTGSIPEVTADVQSASVSANPSVVPVNTPTTNNQTTIRALFLSAENKPVPNLRVRFDLDGDKQSIGGTFTAGNTMVYTDAAGIATTSYVPGSRFSPTDGVTVRACWDKREFPANTCPNETKTTLTVIADSLSVSIGTNNLIGIDDTGLKFVKRYVVQVVDSAGLAAADVQVSASVDLLSYVKGEWVRGTVRWEQRPTVTCDNEDVNRNGVAEVFSNGQSEDANGSFNQPAGRPALEPRKADVALSFEGSNKTNTSGSIVLRLEYPQNIGSWVNFNLVVSASGVAGSEGRADYFGLLEVLASQVNKLDEVPPFVTSPYGTQTSPRIPVSEPGSTRQAASLCTNRN
ncbi:MAG: hypothetical protein HY855_00510 [Burkholderiales bacterium]|nr:hypothetical protein [Burkholderiales bacterium]